MKNVCRIVVPLLLIAVSTGLLHRRDWFDLGQRARAAEPQAGQTDAQQAEDAEPVKRPRVFLDKPARIVWYQLNRLTNQELLLVERRTDDAMYAPVYTAILTRPGMTRQNREEALAGLVAIAQSNPVAELLAAFEFVPPVDEGGRSVSRQLARLALDLPTAELQRATDAFREAATSDKDQMRQTAIAALLLVDKDVSQYITADAASRQDYLRAVRLLPRKQQKIRQRPRVLELLSDPADGVKNDAIITLGEMVTAGDMTFGAVAPLVEQDALRSSAVSTLLAVQERPPEDSAERVLDFLVELAETTPAGERTTESFVDALQLADQLLAVVPVAKSREYRARLREVSVRVIRIKTVEEEMRYDTPYFAVEAGRTVQIVLQNEDLMPHNLVITNPDKLQEVALLGATLPKGEGSAPKQYVPDSPDVLQATDLVPARQTARLTFDAPKQVGEYPFVCTFPRHWMRMYGVMVVVEDLDQWLKNPVEPKDPVGSNRSFVKAWTIDDFEGDLEAELRGRTFEIGERLFAEATCAGCHKINGMGGAVGPELTDVLKRWKGDRRGVLREILDPSHKIDPQYAVQVIYTVDGLVVSGIVKSEDKSSIAVLTNPEDKQPKIIDKEDIDEQVRSDKSMMPKALLDRFSRDEILEILSYIEHAHEHAHEHQH